MALPSPVPRCANRVEWEFGLIYRTNQKITKPQFFESYKSERTNISNLDVASAYITKKAIQSSIALSEKDFTTPANEGVWGGLQSRFNLAVEMIPMMIKIQNASGSKYTSMFVGSIS
jgi:cell cycle checkpoint protein